MGRDDSASQTEAPTFGVYMHMSRCALGAQALTAVNGNGIQVPKRITGEALVYLPGLHMPLLKALCSPMSWVIPPRPTWMSQIPWSISNNSRC